MSYLICFCLLTHTRASNRIQGYSVFLGIFRLARSTSLGRSCYSANRPTDLDCAFALNLNRQVDSVDIHSALWHYQLPERSHRCAPDGSAGRCQIGVSYHCTENLQLVLYFSRSFSPCFIYEIEFRPRRFLPPRICQTPESFPTSLFC